MPDRPTPTRDLLALAALVALVLVKGAMLAAAVAIATALAAPEVSAAEADATPATPAPSPPPPAPMPAPSTPPPAPPPHASVATVVRLLDTEGCVHALGGEPDVRGSAVVFLGVDCPIARAYVPELNALAATVAAKGVRLLGVVSDPAVSREGAARFANEHALAFPLLVDASGTLAERLRPTRTPEAFLLDAAGAVRYRGRIDDRWVALGKKKQVIESRDLAAAIDALAEGKRPPRERTEAVGCAFEAWGAYALPSAPTYARDVAPVLAASCVECHRAGGIAPFPLTTHGEAARKAKTIAEACEERLMPPWRAAPGHLRFADERRLPEREVALLSAWAKAGAPEGDARDLPALPTATAGWRLGTPDLVLEMPEAYEVPAGGDDIYRCFPIPLGNTEDRFVSAVEFRPGARNVVHHAIFFLDNSGKGRERDEKDPGPGYTSFGGPGFLPSGGLGGWAPGATPRHLPAGMGRMARKGSDVILQVHYHPSGKVERDRSSVAIWFAKGPVSHPVVSVPVATRDIDIPPGVTDYRRTADLTLPVDVTLLGITPHMHLLGREMRAQAHLPSGEVVTLIDVPDWDFRWQDQYRLLEPGRLPSGTRIVVSARYDNSEGNPFNPSRPPVRVTWGEATTDEMCFCPIEVTTDHPAQLILLLREVGKRRLGRR